MERIHVVAKWLLWYQRYRNQLTLSDPMSDLIRHYDFPFPDAFLDL
jgi:hypothetical protein